MLSRNNIAPKICKRELGITSSLGRYNFKLLKILICQENTTYLKMWECHSRCSIFYDCHKLYFDNYRTCYSIFGSSYTPHILYKLPAVPRTEKFEDGLCCQITPTELLVKGHHDLHPYYFIAVTAHNWLFQLDIKTGCLMQKVYLSNNHRFRSIGYESYGHSIVLKSTLNVNTNSRMRQDIGQRDVFCVLAFLQAFPLQFIGMMEIHKSIFGADICNVAAMDGILLVSHQSGFVRLYSLRRIFSNSIQFETKLGERCSHDDGGVVGEHPFGLPVNIKIKGRPSLLFEVKCGDNDLQIGGFPWQYIIQPIRNYNTFQVFTLDPPHTVINGFLSYSLNHIEPDRAMFHPDDSGRIIHYSSTEMRFLSLNCSIDASTPVLETLFSLSLNETGDNNSVGLSFTSSRRIIKPKRQIDSVQDEFQHTLIAFHYEDDMDIMSLLLANPSSASCNTVTGRVHFYNNQTGKLLKIIHLNESWNEDSEHDLILDCDVLIHIVKNPRSHSVCYVYYFRSV